MNNFPVAMFLPLAEKPWTVDKNLDLFAKFLTYWSDENIIDGRAAELIFTRTHSGRENRLSFIEVLALVNSGCIDPDFYEAYDDSISVNEHYVHSLVEMYAKVQKALNEHRDQLASIKGTVHGRIKPMVEPPPE